MLLCRFKVIGLSSNKTQSQMGFKRLFIQFQEFHECLMSLLIFLSQYVNISQNRQLSFQTYF
ncbi:unnamed protein product [Paramecium sonneborni]|uniref:Uncharacterized protein n=1 Tax=Paramecium sonneborni TaxID=65129 RepID=A0A8S1NNQ4_9CILI|nr:unnamed protein product [Paramecium sonneborni]